MTSTPTTAHNQWLEKAEKLKPIFAKRARELDERGGSPKVNMDLLRDQGFFSLTVPREYGGEGTDATWCTATANAVQEIVASACASTGWALLSQFHSSGLVAGLGDEEQKRRILGDIVDNGAMIASVGSEVRALETKTAGDASGKVSFSADFKPVDGGFVANAVKGFSSLGADAKYLLYWALAPGTSTPSVGVSVAVVEMPNRGVTFLPGWEEAIGIRASLSGGAKFEDVFIPWENVLGEPGDHMQKHPYLFESTYAAELIGIAQGVLDFVTTTLAERPFLKDDAHNMYVVGEMASDLQAARASLWYAQTLWDVGEFDRAGHATLKALHQAKRTALSVCANATEVVGVRALFKWNPVDRSWRDVRTVSVHTRESLIMNVVAEVETTGNYFAKAKYGERLPADQRVTWASLGLPRPSKQPVAS